MKNNKKIKNNKDISEFMLSEYEHISNAHFESGKSINSFFRYYLLIMSAPALTLLLFEDGKESFITLLSSINMDLNFFLFLMFFMIAIIGYFIFLFIVNKKLEVILYARTVNGIRKYFKDKASDNMDIYLVLPTNTNKPSYFKKSGFYMILPISIINSCFVWLAFALIGNVCLSTSLSIAWFLVHIASYVIMSTKKSNNVE